MSKKVLVAMSGGVDSSVAALLLQEQGHEVVGVTMCFNIASGERRRPSCCGPEGIEDAKRVAGQLGIPHYVLNFGRDLEETVVLDFILEYVEGRTPNPCVRCNQHLKFAALLKKAQGLGIERLATGHFARVEQRRREWFLKKGADSRKDQSYFLCQVRRQDLKYLLFPVGDMTKEQVRAIARKKGLSVAEKPGSQEVCFVPGNDYRAFLKSRLNKAYFKSGDIVDAKGKVLGRHEGVFNYTIGQRGGLGLSGPHPYYVLALHTDKNQVVIGPKAEVYAGSLVAGELNWLAPKPAKDFISAEVKIRYNHPQAPARLTFLGGGRLRADFKEPQAAITPGQFAVFYKDDVVLGGAKILSATCA